MVFLHLLLHSLFCVHQHALVTLLGIGECNSAQDDTILTAIGRATISICNWKQVVLAASGPKDRDKYTSRDFHLIDTVE